MIDRRKGHQEHRRQLRGRSYESQGGETMKIKGEEL